MRFTIVYKNSYFLLINIENLIYSRSNFRPPDLTIPVISVWPSDEIIAKTWCDSSSFTKDKYIYSLRSPYLRIDTISKAFDHDFFEKHYLPNNQIINFRNGNGSVNSNIISKLAQQFVLDIKTGKQDFSDFIILKSRDFNWKQLSGLLVAKYKDYPFVLKLSIEHAGTMVDPYSKSIESRFVFIVGGNIRHLSNFTRISNLEDIKKILMYNPYYLDNVDFPRKWYWQPENNYNLEILWHASPYKSEELFSIPSIYAVISDYIDVDTTIPQQELNKVAMKISTDTDFRIDPHAGNTVIEKGSTRYSLLDTENFRIMTGLDHTLSAKKYSSWLLEISATCIKVYSGRTKQERIKHCFSYTK